MIYATSYLFEISAPSRSEIIFFLNLEYIGILFIPVFWVLITWTYHPSKDQTSKVQLKKLRFIYMIPVTLLIFVFTNPYHHLMYKSIDIEILDSLSLLKADRAIGFWVVNSVLILLFITGSARLIYSYIVAEKTHRRHYLLLLFASLPPFVSYMLVLSQSIPYCLDLGPLAFALSGLLIYWGILNMQLFNLVSIAEHMVIDAMRDAMLVLDTQGCLLQYNKQAHCFFPEACSSNIGLPIENLNPEIHEIFSTMHADVDAQIILPQSQEKRSYSIRRSPILDKYQVVKGYLLLFHDITQVRSYVEELENLASRDGLTNLFNHRHFMNMAHQKAKSMAEQEHGFFSLVMVDLDFFKEINDTYGHRAGDMVLVRTAQVIQESCSGKDFCARYGGEEFVMLLSDTQLKEACAKANQLCTTISKIVFPCEDRQFSVTASFGVSTFIASDGIAWDVVLSKADTALYRAKKAGKNQVVCM